MITNETDKPKLSLYGEICIVSIFSMLINGIIMGFTCTNCPIITIILFLFVLLPALLVGFIVFLVLRRTKAAKIINGKNIGIFCVVVAGIIIAPAAINYYYVVPPKDVTHTWIVDNNQTLQKQMLGISIFYDTTYGSKGGYFLNGGSGDGFYISGYKVINDSGFRWNYDTSSKELTLQQGNIWKTVPRGWQLTLRLTITTTNASHPTITTQYVRDVNFPFCNATLFNDVTWTAKDWGLS